MNNGILKERLDEFLRTHYDGSFSRTVCDYIHTTGMTEKEVEALLEAMKDMSKQQQNNDEIPGI